MTPSVHTVRARQFAAVLCGAAAVLTAALALWLGLTRGERDVAVLGETGDPSETVARFFHALCLRDWEEASSYVRGGPELDPGQPPEDAAERAIWEAFLRSWSWSMDEGGKTDDMTAWQTVNFTCLRPDVFTDGMNEDIREILKARVDETETLREVYTEDGQFREEVVRDALQQVLEARLGAPERYAVTTAVTVQLTYESGRWQILPEEALWNVLSGVPEGGGV